MNQGYLSLILGPMFSGKTSALINRYNTINNTANTIVINHSSDDRYDKTGMELVSHDNVRIPCFCFKKLRDIYNLECDFNNIKYILINEAQFFEDLLIMVTIFVEKYNMHVYIAGLDGDYKKKKFGQIMDLIPLADDITKLKSKCKCGMPAPFTKRITDENKQILVGTCNYEPTCRKCHNY
jgi:thymidine kinase